MDTITWLALLILCPPIAIIFLWGKVVKTLLKLLVLCYVIFVLALIVQLLI